MTDNELKELVAGLAVAQAETDLKFKETAAQINRNSEQQRLTEDQMKRTDASLERIGIRLGNISANNGSTAEDYFFNSLEEKPTFGGVTYDTIKRNVHAIRFRLEDEYDIVMYNGDSIALIECKYKAHENDLRKLIEKKVDNFRLLFPYYQEYKIYLGIASFSFYPELEFFAKQNGVGILKQKGETIEIVADNLKVY
jgi:hypothetical protein